MHRHALIRFGSLVLWVGTGGVWAGTAAAAGAATAPAQVLFMGTDLSIQQGKKFHRVEDVDGSEFVIKVAGESRFVRTRMQSNNLKLHPGLKLSPVSVQLDELRGGGGYTPANDPRHRFNARAGGGGALQAARDWSGTRHDEAVRSLSQAQQGPVEFRKQFEDIIDQEKGKMGVMDQQLGSDYTHVPGMANALALELAEGNFDMVDVSFRLSSPVKLDDPYMVVLVEFEPRGAKPGETSLLIHAKSLDPIGPDPKYIRIREGGMPVGFKYVRQEVHIYNRGKEVATNVSSKRVELNHDEAREYLLIEHLSTHKGGTVPAAAVPGSLPPDTRLRLAPDQLQRVCYVRVAQDGKLLGVFVDESTNLPLPDAAVSAVLAEAFFKPALLAGKPKEGVVRVRLADLTL